MLNLRNIEPQLPVDSTFGFQSLRHLSTRNFSATWRVCGRDYFHTSMLRCSHLYCRILSAFVFEWRLIGLLGWLTSIAWIAGLAIGSIFVGGIIQGLIILNHPSYEPQPYHVTLLSFAVIFVAMIVNTVFSSLLPIIQGFILIFHVLGFFGILITLVCMAPHGKASTVFTTSLNAGNWPTQGISYCVGFIGNVATFVGQFIPVFNSPQDGWRCEYRRGCICPCKKANTDSTIVSAHNRQMSEEIENASWNVPRAIITTMVLNGAMGWAMVIAALFCLGDDPESVLVSILWIAEISTLSH